jgi:osmoprotectant transport system ATP-binding protein
MTTDMARHETSAAAAASVSGAELQLDQVTKRYPGQREPAVDGLSLTIPAGEIVTFVGPSGCGKTTSLKMINRLIEPTSGSITIDGNDVRDQGVDDLRRQIGYVIQGGSLFPHMTVGRNIGLVPRLLGWSRRRTSQRVDDLLDLVGLDPSAYRDRYPRELSGGQQQRVGVARGLAADPPVILMDEPFGAVDPITRQRLQDELLGIQRELRKTVVCVTHDIDEAIKLGDRILILKQHAQIAQYDTPDAILAAPADDFVDDFVGSGAALKQLSLSRVSAIELSRPTTARVGERTADVLARAEAAGDTAVVVLDERERAVAWRFPRQLRRTQSVAPGDREALVTVDERATLNDALDTMLVSGHGGAIVSGDRDRYLGVVDFHAVTDFMSTWEAQHEEAAREKARRAGKQT